MYSKRELISRYTEFKVYGLDLTVFLVTKGIIPKRVSEDYTGEFAVFSRNKDLDNQINIYLNMQSVQGTKDSKWIIKNLTDSYSLFYCNDPHLYSYILNKGVYVVTSTKGGVEVGHVYGSSAYFLRNIELDKIMEEYIDLFY